jgi:hypothetical protein
VEGWKNVAYDLRTIALLNPRLALMLAKGQPLAPRSYSMALTWDTVAPGVPIQNSLQERMYQDAWVTGFYYTIRAPLANAGSLFKLQVDTARKQNPYVNIDMRVEGPDRFEITNGYMPLENICDTNDVHRDLLNRGWVISRDQNLFVQAVLDRTLSDDEIPYTVWLTMTCLELSGCNLRAIGFQEAVCALRNMGLYPTPGA